MLDFQWFMTVLLKILCRGGRIRTYDLHIPNVARYRATLHPELGIFVHSLNCYGTQRYKNSVYCKQMLFFYCQILRPVLYVKDTQAVNWGHTIIKLSLNRRGAGIVPSSSGQDFERKASAA